MIRVQERMAALATPALLFSRAELCPPSWFAPPPWAATEGTRPVATDRAKAASTSALARRSRVARARARDHQPKRSAKLERNDIDLPVGKRREIDGVPLPRQCRPGERPIRRAAAPRYSKATGYLKLDAVNPARARPANNP